MNECRRLISGASHDVRPLPGGGCRVPPRRAGNFHLLAQMKVTKAKCLNTDLGRRLFGKSSRLGGTERIAPFPRGLARRGAASHFLRLEVAPFENENFVLSGPTEQIIRAVPSCRRRLPVYDVATRRRVGEETVRCATLRQRPLQFSAKHSNQIRVQALCFGDFHLGQQMKVTRPPGRDPAPHTRNRPPERNPAQPRRGKDGCHERPRS